MRELIRRWRDDRRRTRKRLAPMRRADVLFVSHAKAGRTWLRALISHVYHRRYGMAADELIEFDNFHRRVERIPSVFFTHEANEPPAIRRRLPAIARDAERVLLMVRDPRDVAVSYYFHHLKRSNPRVRARLGMPADLSTVAIAEFVRDPRFGLPAIVDFMNRWERCLAGHPRALVVRYEDLRARPEAELARVMRFLGEEVDEADLRAAVVFASFGALKEKEREGFFASERMRPRDATDPEAFKVRRGKVGGYRDYFDAATVAQLDELVRSRLSPSYGYGGDGTVAGGTVAADGGTAGDEPLAVPGPLGAVSGASRC